jgi:hypothetical protein
VVNENQGINHKLLWIRGGKPSGNPGGKPVEKM